MGKSKKFIVAVHLNKKEKIQRMQALISSGYRLFETFELFNRRAVPSLHETNIMVKGLFKDWKDHVGYELLLLFESSYNSDKFKNLQSNYKGIKRGYIVTLGYGDIEEYEEIKSMLQQRLNLLEEWLSELRQSLPVYRGGDVVKGNKISNKGGQVQVAETTEKMEIKNTTINSKPMKAWVKITIGIVTGAGIIFVGWLLGKIGITSNGQ